MKFKYSIPCFVFIVLFAGFSFAADTAIVTEDVVYYKDGKDFTGYLARPDDNQKHPGLILIHEWWGLNEHIRGNARKFARLGYVSLAVDLYEGKSATSRKEAKNLATSVRKDLNGAKKKKKSAVSYIKGHSNVNPERVASIGWCFGGGWSYQIAKNNLGVKASIIYYGRFNPTDDLSRMRAAILGHFGANDRAIKVDTVYEFQAKLKTLSGDHEIYIYENAGHAFANETGSRYSKEAADLAWKRTLDFLRRNL